MPEPPDILPDPEDLPPTVTIPVPITLLAVEPPAGLKVYEKETLGILVYIPEMIQTMLD